MELKIIEGCICDSFTADGKDIDSLSEKELKDILKAAIAKITTTNYKDENIIYCLQNTLYEIVSRFYDEYESDGKPCECCGDFVETFKMDIIL